MYQRDACPLMLIGINADAVPIIMAAGPTPPTLTQTLRILRSLVATIEAGRVEEVDS